MLAAARKDLLLDRLRRDGRIVAKEIAAQSVQEQVFARSGEHSTSFLLLHVSAVLFRV